MIVFKTFFKVLKEYKVTLILFTTLLIVFGAFRLQTKTETTDFKAEKPNVFIINHDKDGMISKQLETYIKENANIKEIEQSQEAINDAIFYRDVQYVIEIPNQYTDDFMEGENPEIKIKSTGDFEASYMEMLLERYVKIANLYQKENNTSTQIVEQMNKTLEEKVEVEVTSKLDTSNLSNATFFYNFANYSILAGCVFIIAIIMSSFKQKDIQKRIIISSMKNSSYNRYLFLASIIFGICLWAIYVVISIILVKDAMLSIRGIFYMINSFIFTICALSIAFLIGNLIASKDAINGIVNVIALGSSFLCGSFVPAQWLPDAVIQIAHILPSYWYIQNNELIATIEELNLQALQPFMINLGVVLVFTIGFIVITNIITKLKRRKA